jgi:hypothetical protein
VPEPKKSSAMLPLIIVGATIFAFGTYQSMKPKEPEVNPTFVAASETPTSPKTAPANPVTMQAPDAPLVGKDAAQDAAEATEITISKAKAETNKVEISVTNAPWLKALMTGVFGNFREGVLGSLKAEQDKGGINCTPVLNTMTDADIAKLEKVSCTGKDGGQITGEFDEDGEGDLRVEYPNGGMVKISKNGGNFNVETRNSGQ